MTYENEITYLKNWISDRMAWLDDQLDHHKFPYSVPPSAALDDLDMQIFPNPVLNEMNILLRVDRPCKLQVEVYNTLAQNTFQEELDLAGGSQTLHFDAGMVEQAMPQPGMYYLNIKIDGIPAGARRIMKIGQ